MIMIKNKLLYRVSLFFGFFVNGIIGVTFIGIDIIGLTNPESRDDLQELVNYLLHGFFPMKYTLVLGIIAIGSLFLLYDAMKMIKSENKTVLPKIRDFLMSYIIITILFINGREILNLFHEFDIFLFAQLVFVLFLQIIGLVQFFENGDEQKQNK